MAVWWSTAVEQGGGATLLQVRRGVAGTQALLVMRAHSPQERVTQQHDRR